MKNIIHTCGELATLPLMSNTNYGDCCRNIDFRHYPELYRIGRSEQGVMIAKPYKSEILPYWKFKTVDITKRSTQDIYKLFCEYKQRNDFIGMDTARKFLQMGYTRARRCTNHPSGHKYASDGSCQAPHIINTQSKPVRL